MKKVLRILGKNTSQDNIYEEWVQLALLRINFVLMRILTLDPAIHIQVLNISLQRVSGISTWYSGRQLKQYIADDFLLKGSVRDK